MFKGTGVELGGKAPPGGAARVDLAVATTHRSLFPHGAYWAYDWSGPTPAGNVSAGIAVRGSLVAVVGSGRAVGSGWNHVVLEWRY